MSFNCPLLFHHQETLFHPLNLTSQLAKDYTAISIQNRIQRNPGYFHFERVNSFLDPDLDSNTLTFHLKVPELMIRYEIPVWQKMFQLWVKFVSLYIIFYWAAQKVKNFAYGKYWVRAWEVIPWKKIY